VEDAIDGSDNVFVVEDINNRVQELSSSGSFVRMWGWGVDDGSLAFQVCTSGCQAGVSGSGDGQFNSPNGLATDSSGNVYVGDDASDRIQRFGPTGTFVTKWGSTGTQAGQFMDPVGIATAGQLMYVTEASNHRVQLFSYDHAAPKTTITAGPTGQTHDRTPTFRFKSSERNSTFRCAVDHGSFRSCSSPFTTKRLSFGSHSFRVRATDISRNTDATPAKRGFSVAP